MIVYRYDLDIFEKGSWDHYSLERRAGLSKEPTSINTDTPYAGKDESGGGLVDLITAILIPYTFDLSFQS